MRNPAFINFLVGSLSLIAASTAAKADGIVSQVVSAPVFANGILRNERSGINVYLQNDQSPGLDFMDPKVLGYGIPPGGMMEVEMESGFQRDPNIPLNDKSLLLTVGAPQQGLPDHLSDHSISQGDNPNTFVITPNGRDGLLPENLGSPAPGAKDDPIPLRGIKIVHVGRASAFISRGDAGVVAVRIKDSSGNVIARGRSTVDFLKSPSPQVFLTNIPHDRRNHNWQRVGRGEVVGVANRTLPLPLLLYAKNEGLGRIGIPDAGALSSVQLKQVGINLDAKFGDTFAGLILRDSDGNKKLDPRTDEVIGVIQADVPNGATGYQVLTPIVNDEPFLSIETGRFNPRAGKAVGGTIMQVVFLAGDIAGKYRLSFSMFKKPGDLESLLSPPAIYTVVVE